MAASSLRHTALHGKHQGRGATFTEFQGWEMPIFYTSILEEHQAVRQSLGLFDVSHMGQVLLTGKNAVDTLNELVVSDITQVAEGGACYTLMLNERGGIIDDLIVFRIGPTDFLTVVNCANRARDMEWLIAHRQGDTGIADISDGRSILAVQGPLACRVLEQLLDARVTSLRRFGIAPIRTMGPAACIARTGYTGGDGFELLVPDQHAVKLWDAILAASQHAGGRPVGLGARDSLRVEAGLRLHGSDMDATTTPYEADLGWTVAINKPSFIGKNVLVKQKQRGVTKKFVGFEMAKGPVPRMGYPLMVKDQQVGAVTSGTFSPLLKRPVGMGYVEAKYAKMGTNLAVTIRNQPHQATIVKLPFWKGDSRPAAVRSTAGLRLKQTS